VSRPGEQFAVRQSPREPPAAAVRGSPPWSDPEVVAPRPGAARSGRGRAASPRGDRHPAQLGANSYARSQMGGFRPYRRRTAKARSPGR
jgi:hypothetical protein